jgi:hypothetical protein
MATTTINNCIIHDCDATTDGGGINIKDDSDVSITNVEIYNCTATTDGGGIATQNVAIIAAENLDIHDCSAGADGGGICLSGYSSDNDYQFRWSLIRDNSASAASGGVCIKDNASAETRLQHCVVSGNTAPSVGGVGHESGTTYAVNCTIVDNDDDGINSDSGTVYATNCIIWGNDTQVSVTGSGTAYVTSSNVQGGYGGAGNVSGTPVFAERGKHYYALDGICAAVDSANSGATNYLGVYMLGRSEYDHYDVANTGVGTPAYADMGAYEFIGVPNDSMKMSQYYLNMDSELSADEYVYQYSIIRLPEMPQQWGGASLVQSPRYVRHKVSSEIEIDDSTTTLDEWVRLSNHVASYRTLSGSTYPSPTRDAEYDNNFQSSDPYVAEDTLYPDRILLIDGIPCLILEMSWKNDLDSAYDVCRVYTVDVMQTHDLGYSSGLTSGSNQTWFYLPPGMHPGDTVLAPDVPVSAWHVRVLQDAVSKILHECKFAASIPVWGVSKNVVV